MLTISAMLEVQENGPSCRHRHIRANTLCSRSRARGSTSRCASTIGLACNRPSLLGSEVDLEIAPLVGAEIIAGSTRLKAGTATKMILNMISTGAMVRIGKTLGNRMVDLMPSNEKLRIRSRRILRELAGVDDAAGGSDLVTMRWSLETGTGCCLDGRRS